MMALASDITYFSQLDQIYRAVRLTNLTTIDTDIDKYRLFLQITHFPSFCFHSNVHGDWNWT